jgi:hypothetical protein
VAVVFPAGRPADDQAGLALLRKWGLEVRTRRREHRVDSSRHLDHRRWGERAAHCASAAARSLWDWWSLKLRGTGLMRSAWLLQPVIHDPFGGRRAPAASGPGETEDAGDGAARFLAGCFNTCLPDAERARALEDAFLDESCAAVVCGRGGYGCMRLLELLDWGRLSPAVLLGLGRIVALHYCPSTLYHIHLYIRYLYF